MANYIDADKAIETLEKMKADRLKKSCQKSSLYEANALGYAIAIIKKLPKKVIDD